MSKLGVYVYREPQIPHSYLNGLFAMATDAEPHGYCSIKKLLAMQDGKLTNDPSKTLTKYLSTEELFPLDINQTHPILAMLHKESVQQHSSE